MKAVIALDLDQTLIFSERSAELLPGLDTVWVEDYQNAPLSLMTRTAYEQLETLTGRHHVVPVTTRTPEQYGRVRLPGQISRVVCANGGVLLCDGQRDPAWDARTARLLDRAAPAADVAAQVRTVERHAWVRTVRQVEGLFVYLVAQQRDHIPPAWLDELISWTGPLGWSVSVQGRKVYVVPDVLNKGDAAVDVAALLGGPLLAAGDSLLDVRMLERAMFAIRPAHGELHLRDFRPPGLHITRRGGARATEEILIMLAGAADDLVRGTLATTVAAG